MKRQDTRGQGSDIHEEQQHHEPQSGAGGMPQRQNSRGRIRPTGGAQQTSGQRGQPPGEGIGIVHPPDCAADEPADERQVDQKQKADALQTGL